jgi:hypothetical protein
LKYRRIRSAWIPSPVRVAATALQLYEHARSLDQNHPWRDVGSHDLVREIYLYTQHRIRTAEFDSLQLGVATSQQTQSAKTFSRGQEPRCKRLRVYRKLATRADHRTNPSATYIGLGLSRRPSSTRLATTLELRPAMPAKPGGSGPTGAKDIKIRHHDDDQQCL